MFRDVISQTPFTNEVADGFFPNIVGDSYNNDTTFLASLRALVAPRMTGEDSLYLGFSSSHYTASQAESLTSTKIVKTIYDEDRFVNGSFTVHSFNSSEENNKVWLDLMKEHFTKVYKDWVMIDKVTAFFAKSFYILCFINKESKKVVIMIDELDVPAYHFIQLIIPVVLPWYFNGDNQIKHDSIEHEFLKSFNEKTSDHFNEIINKLAEPYDFRTLKIKQLLSGFETQYEQREMERVRAKINDHNARIDAKSNEIKDLLTSIREWQIRLLGLEAKIEAGEENSEMMDFFLRNKNITVNRVDQNGDLYFTVHDIVDNFDEDYAAKVILDSDSSYVYKPNGRSCNNYIPVEDIRMLMSAIFLEQTLKLRFCATYCLSMSGGAEGQSYSGYTYVQEHPDYMPNPHIDYHNCLGNYRPLIIEALRANEYIGAISQCIASCKSLNFSDSTVMSEFMTNIYGFPSHTVNNKCIELPDGRVVRPKEAIEWLKEQGTEEVKSEESDE